MAQKQPEDRKDVLRLKDEDVSSEAWIQSDTYVSVEGMA